jgi:hypothetical protein
MLDIGHTVLLNEETVLDENRVGTHAKKQGICRVEGIIDTDTHCTSEHWDGARRKKSRYARKHAGHICPVEEMIDTDTHTVLLNAEAVLGKTRAGTHANTQGTYVPVEEMIDCTSELRDGARQEKSRYARQHAGHIYPVEEMIDRDTHTENGNVRYTLRIAL